MAQPPPFPLPETDTNQETQESPFVSEEANEPGIQTEGGDRFNLSSIEMSDPGGSGQKPYGYGKDWSYLGGASSSSFKYSHEETRPEKIREKMKDLHNDMQDTLRRLDNLEAKLKNGAGKRRKKSNSNSARREEELQKALSNIMKDVGDDASK